MSECYIQCDDNLPVACDDCDWKGTAGQTDMVSDIQERLTPGGVVPAGQCPECGSLVYLIEDKAPAATPANPVVNPALAGAVGTLRTVMECVGRLKAKEEGHLELRVAAAGVLSAYYGGTQEAA